jgi:hypothetical protein
MLTRRTFIQGAGVLAAGTAVGGMIFKGTKEHGPIGIRMFFFGKEPIVIDGDLLSDELRDVFRIRSFDKGDLMATAELKLSEVKKAVATPGKTVRMEVAMQSERGIVENGFISVVARGETLTFLIDEKIGPDPSPVWIMLEDVRRVL